MSKMLGYRARNGSGNPLWNEVEQRLQRTARPEFSTNGVVSQNVVNEGRAQKNKNTIFAPNLINNQ